MQTPETDAEVMEALKADTPLNRTRRAFSSCSAQIDQACRQRKQMPQTDLTNPQPRTLSLREVLEGAERAQERVSRWPEWKRELSPSTASERGEVRASSDEK